jgi:hypothetical protein
MERSRMEGNSVSILHAAHPVQWERGTTEMPLRPAGSCDRAASKGARGDGLAVDRGRPRNDRVSDAEAVETLLGRAGRPC